MKVVCGAERAPDSKSWRGEANEAVSPSFDLYFLSGSGELMLRMYLDREACNEVLRETPNDLLSERVCCRHRPYPVQAWSLKPRPAFQDGVELVLVQDGFGEVRIDLEEMIYRLGQVNSERPEGMSHQLSGIVLFVVRLWFV